MGGRPGQRYGFRCTRIYRKTKNKSFSAPRAHSPCRIALPSNLRRLQSSRAARVHCTRRLVRWWVLGWWMDLRGIHTEWSAPETKLVHDFAQNTGGRREEHAAVVLPGPFSPTEKNTMRNSWSQLQHSKRPSAAGDGSNSGYCGDAAGQVRRGGPGPTSQPKPVRGPVDAWTREEDELVWQCAEMGHGRLETARLLPGRSDDAIQKRWWKLQDIAAHARVQAPTRPPPRAHAAPAPRTPANELLVPTWVVSLVIPANWKPGMKMATTLKNGRRVIITPPDDAKPGMPLKCKVPATEADAPASADAPAPAAKMVEEVRPRRAGAFDTATKGTGACASEVAAREQSEELAPFGRNSGKLAALSARAISEDRGPRDTLCGARQVRRLPLARPCPACGLTLSRSTLSLTSLCADCLRAVQPKVLSVPAVRHPLWPDEADRDEAPRTKWRRSEASPGTGGGGCYDTLRHAPPFYLIADVRRMAFPLPSSFTVSQGRQESFGEKRRKRIRQSTVGQTREVMVKEEDEPHIESRGTLDTQHRTASRLE